MPQTGSMQTVSMHGDDGQGKGRARAGRWLPPFMLLLGLTLLVVAIYSNSFSVPFQFDDKPNIVDKPLIKQLSNLLTFSGSRSVGFLTFALNYHFGRLDPFGYHLVNLLIHLINGGLVTLLVLLLCRVADRSPLTPDSLRLTAASSSATPSAPLSAQWIALSTAALFMVHPVQTEAVTYIVQRFASLAALFYLLTVVCYLRWRISPAAKQRYLWYGAALLATVLAMKTKENTFTLPFMLLLVESVFFGLPSRRGWLGLLPFFLTLPIIPLSLHMIPFSPQGPLGKGKVVFARDFTDISRLDYLFTQFRVIVTYLRLLVLPIHQTLDYDYPVYHSLFRLPVLVSFLGLLGLGGGALWLLLRKPASSPAVRLAAFGVLWFFLTLSIESSIIPIRDVIYEHRLYLPGIGLFLAASALLFGAPAGRRLRNAAAVAVGLVVVILAIATYERNTIWQSEQSLWQDVVRKSPNKARGHSNLGASFADQEQWTEALGEYQIALTLHPDRPTFTAIQTNMGNAYTSLGRLDAAQQAYAAAISSEQAHVAAHNGLGNVYRLQGRAEPAFNEFQKALRLDPDSTEAHNNLGLLFQAYGKLDAALQQFDAAIRLNPEFAEAYNNRGLVFGAQGRLDDAIAAFQQALALNDHLAEAHHNLGLIYSRQGRTEEAMREYQLALTLNPGYAEAHNDLGNLYLKLQRLDDAQHEYQRAVSSNPDYARAHYNLGVVYYQQGRLSDALEEFRTAVQLRPDDAQAHNNLGVVYQDQGRVDQAIVEFQAALSHQPRFAEAYYNLGTAYQQTGQRRKAVQSFEQLLQLQPGDERGRRALQKLGR
jgi:tetratricopeptide (TPR) repeat protein